MVLLYILQRGTLRILVESSIRAQQSIYFYFIIVNGIRELLTRVGLLLVSSWIGNIGRSLKINECSH